ncbi:periplasmic binding protein-like II, partial [Periconia macrospinosa]
NITVDLSKYHDGNLDQQLANDNVYVDSIILQTLQDFPRWKKQEALLKYAPLNFSKIYPEFRDDAATYMGLEVVAWSIIYNRFSTDSVPLEYTDFLKPEFKDKLVLTYPNDDDAVLFQFNLILQKYGTAWFDALLGQNPRWVRGTATPTTLLAATNSSYSATFTSTIGLNPFGPFNISFPLEGSFVSWPQTGAILRNAPHPEGAKLLHNFMLSNEFINASGGWSVRSDIPAPKGYSKILEQHGTDVTAFGRWMNNRANVERLRFFFESRLGTAQGPSPLEDNL